MNIQKQYLTPNPFSRPCTTLTKVKGVVVHYVGNPNSKAISNRNYFESLRDTKKTYASSHYIIGLDGEIIQCIPENEIAYCSNDRNVDTLSIENCHLNADGKFNSKTYDSLVSLLADICIRYKLNPLVDIIRHYDVNGKICPIYYVKNPNEWEELKNDVKERFISNIDVTGLHKIMGKFDLSKEQFLSYRKTWKEVPKLNCSFSELVDLYYEIGGIEGVRADYALCQAIHETGRFQFGGIVLASQNNYAGLGAVDGNDVGNANTFVNVRDGVTAHIQHLKGYASKEGLKLACKDLRYKYINPLGDCPYLEWLSIPNNPYGKGWASDKGYFGKLMGVYDGVKVQPVNEIESLLERLYLKTGCNKDYWRKVLNGSEVVNVEWLKTMFIKLVG